MNKENNNSNNSPRLVGEGLGVRRLFKDTAIYGLSSIVGRFLNYLLVPLYTHCMPKDSGDYGVSVNMYAYTALVLVFLTFGMETSLFRFANKEGEKPDTVFSTSISVVSVLSFIFLAFIFGFTTPISDGLGYSAHPEYIEIMAITIALDSIRAIPFSYLRFQKKPIKFASFQLLNIALNIGLNMLFFLVLGKTQVIYVFVINLICSAIVTFLFVPDFFKIKWHWDFGLLKRMLTYSWPLVILGVAGILNQVADKIIYPLLCPDKMDELGVYGACVKIAMIMAMITQAFRYAYEPIVFAKAKDKNSKDYYAQAMKFFLIFTLFAFICVIGYMPILQYIIGADYRAGLKVVPIVMAAEIMYGVYFNLSFWYKLIDKTIWGAWFSLAGCAVLIAVNIIFIPKFSYMACAWGGVAGYGTAMVLSYIVGQIKNPINYELGRLGTYVLATAVIFVVMTFATNKLPSVAELAVNTLLIIGFLGLIIKLDMPLSSLPVIGKKFRK